jgi:RNA polymerase sigma-70 factor (ECF subfamily)
MLSHSVKNLAKALFNRFRAAKTESEENDVGRAIVEMLHPRVYWIIRAGTREEVAEDVMQEFWVSLFTGLPQFRGDSDGQAWGLCRAIAIRRSIDWIREKSKVTMVSLDSEEIWDEVEASAKVVPFAPGERLDAEEVMKLLGACDPADVLLINLRYFEGLAHKEIGRFVGLSEGAVHMRIHRALETATAAITKGERYV